MWCGVRELCFDALVHQLELLTDIPWVHQLKNAECFELQQAQDRLMPLEQR